MIDGWESMFWDLKQRGDPRNNPELMAKLNEVSKEDLLVALKVCVTISGMIEERVRGLEALGVAARDVDNWAQVEGVHSPELWALHTAITVFNHHVHAGEPKRSLYGAFTGSGLSATAEEIAESSRETWGTP